MQTTILRVLTVAAVAMMAAAVATAGAPSFVVKCVRTSGTPVDAKYGTYYFFLKEGEVKGFACSQPGRPCQIVSQDGKKIVFQTPGEDPDTLIIDLRSGAIQKTRSDGLQWTYACRQVPYQQ